MKATFCSYEDRAIYETIFENMVQTDRPKMTIRYGSCAFCAG